MTWEIGAFIIVVAAALAFGVAFLRAWAKTW
jgi:hypothetical protein